MLAKAKDLQFEEAAQIRDELQEIKSTLINENNLILPC